jgi:hypothetical protein
MYPGLGASPTDIYSQSPQATGALLTWNASALGCTTAEYAFYVQKPGSTFKVLQSYGAATNAVWNTAGLPRGIYKVKVLTRRAGSTAPFDVYAISTYELV